MKTGIIVLFSVLVALSGITSGQEQRRTGMETRRSLILAQRPLRPGLREESFLSSEQKEAVKAIRMKSYKELKPLKDEMREMMAHHITLTTSEKPDMQEIYKSIDKMGEVKAEIAKKVARQNQDIRALLTDVQLQKFDQMRSGIRGRLHNRISDRPLR